MPDGGRGGEVGLNDGRVHHHSLWQVEVVQLPQESHPVLGFEGADVPVSPEVLDDEGAR